MSPDELTLASIDNQRHLVTSVELVSAVAFAARSGHTDRIAYRFVTALVMTDTLGSGIRWPEVLSIVAELTREEERREAEATPKPDLSAASRMFGSLLPHPGKGGSP